MSDDTLTFLRTVCIVIVASVLLGVGTNMFIDDLVKRLRTQIKYGVIVTATGAEAADRIEKLEAALQMSEMRFKTLKQAYDRLRNRNIQLYGSAALEGNKDER